MTTKRTPPSRMAPSTPRLSEYARKFVYPSTIIRTVWTRVAAKGLELGLGFDWWQSQLGTVCLGYDASGRYVATVGGIGMSIPRQVGKTYFVLAMLVILCILFPGLQVVWTAHHLRTTTKTFTTLRGICRRKKIAPYIAVDGRGKPAMRSSNGEQQVDFKNGSAIMFGARSQGFGRGFDVIDVEVFDEAQILDTKALEDMIAATNQARHEHGALLFFMGTPPRRSDPSEAFQQRRDEAWSGEAVEDAIWLELSADPDSNPDDERQWPGMNPSYPKRTPRESMLRLRKNLKDDDSWNREGRGIWDRALSSGIFGTAWKDNVALERVGGPIGALGLAASVDGKSAAVVGAVKVGDGVVVKPLLHGDGTDWLAVELKLLQAELGVPVIVDGKGPGSALLPHLKRRGVRMRVLTTEDVLNACAQAEKLVMEQLFEHANYPELNAAVEGAAKRPVGDRWALGRRSSSDISPLEAAILAAWWVSRPPQKAPPPPLPQPVDELNVPQHDLATAGF